MTLVGLYDDDDDDNDDEEEENAAAASAEAPETPDEEVAEVVLSISDFDFKNAIRSGSNRVANVSLNMLRSCHMYNVSCNKA
eukprot:CAMPEP_0113479198 /NCGR_PEP_ID=MMETSP0014_2-20120614/21177_1 /TAXON_ID=2857 /ORGANISM="Nitzschia sp." /LENGTH=81 /DNA_ID=CAMNT_0000372471 /DNA_START=58 /DNA_END=303 /DNA_ORIENTATION=- /assembly_acc=CAM_ASM_000159